MKKGKSCLSLEAAADLSLYKFLFFHLCSPAAFGCWLIVISLWISAYLPDEMTFYNLHYGHHYSVKWVEVHISCHLQSALLGSIINAVYDPAYLSGHSTWRHLIHSFFLDYRLCLEWHCDYSFQHFEPICILNSAISSTSEGHYCDGSD